jgi:drug/metabolite transporter (DMT)-like permease
MGISPGILFALLAMFSCGITDFLIKIATDREHYFNVYVIARFIGLIFIAVYAFSLMGEGLFVLPPTTELVALLIFTSALSAFSTLLFFKAVSLGKVSVVVPISYSFPAVSVVVSILLLNESLTWSQGIGILLAIAGVILVSTDVSKLGSRGNLADGVPEALITMVCWGVSMVLLKVIVDAMGSVWTTTFLSAIRIAIILLFGLFMKKKLSVPKGGSFMGLVLVGIGFFAIFGTLAYNTGISTENVSLVSPVSSMGPAVTLVLAWLFLKESLVLNQKIGIACILVAVWIIAGGF